MSDTQFPLLISPNDDGTYTVTCALFNIVTQGDSLEEAIQHGQEAIQCHIEGCDLMPDEDYRILKDGRKQSFTTFVPVSYA